MIVLTGIVVSVDDKDVEKPRDASLRTEEKKAV